MMSITMKMAVLIECRYIKFIKINQIRLILNNKQLTRYDNIASFQYQIRYVPIVFLVELNRYSPFQALQVNSRLSSSNVYVLTIVRSYEVYFNLKHQIFSSRSIIQLMEHKLQGLQTLDPSLSTKEILLQDNSNLKQNIREYFIKTYDLYQKLFEILATDEAYYIRAEPLRHPLIFYYGHTASAYVNKLYDWGIIKERVNPEYENMFAVGVDEMDWDDLSLVHYDWPSVAETKAFKAKAKKVVLDAIDSISINCIENWKTELWVVLLGIQHERIHIQTSAVIMRRVPLEMIKSVQGFIQCPCKKENITETPKNQMMKVAPWKASWDRKFTKPKTYGWDNQFGEKQFDVKEFHASKFLVSNGEFLQFVEDGGYSRPELWTDEGQRWLLSIKPQMPLFWRKSVDSYQLRTLFHQIAMPWDWPAEVNNLEARAFCRWRTQKTGCYTRLPMEDEYYALRSILKEDQPEWGYQQAGNINLEIWMSPNPVDMFKTGDFCDIVGNVWQHTLTPTYPFKKFDIHPSFQDFTTPTFDDRHDLIKGGSFISTGNLSLYNSRYAFRRHFHQFAGFRYIQSDFKLEVDSHACCSITDKNVEMNLKHHYLNKNSYVIQVVQKIKEVMSQFQNHHRALTVGCSVGRIPLQLGKMFDQSIGIDCTTRYFQISSRLKETGFLKFKDIDIELKLLDIFDQNVKLIQMNPQNPDERKINMCDCIVIDGYSIKKGSIEEVLENILKLAGQKAIIALLSVSGFNDISKEEAQKLISRHTGCKVEVGSETRLKTSGEDQSYLPEKNDQMEFRLNFFRVEK